MVERETGHQPDIVCPKCGMKKVKYWKKSGLLKCTRCGYVLQQGGAPSMGVDFSSGDSGVDDLLNLKPKKGVYTHIHEHYHIGSDGLVEMPQRPRIFDEIEAEVRAESKAEEKAEQEKQKKFRAEHKGGVSLLSDIWGEHSKHVVAVPQHKPRKELGHVAVAPQQKTVKQSEHVADAHPQQKLSEEEKNKQRLLKIARRTTEKIYPDRQHIEKPLSESDRKKNLLRIAKKIRLMQEQKKGKKGDEHDSEKMDKKNTK